MALAGAPLLLTQTATTLRMAVETEDGFVQQASTGLTNPSIGNEPLFVFEDAVVAKEYLPGTNQTTLRLLGLDLVARAGQGAGNPGDFTFAYSSTMRHFAGLPKGGSNVTAVRIGINPEHTELSFATLSGFIGGPQNLYERIAYSPDGAMLAVASRQSSSGANMRAYRHVNESNVAELAVSGSLGVYRDLEWSRDSRFLFANPQDPLYPYIHIFERTGAGSGQQLNRIGQLNLGRAGQDVAMSPDGVFLAVSGVEDVEGLTVYTTYLFKRSADEFLPIGSIPNFGNILKFSEDGLHLYDPGATRRAFRRSGNAFNELVDFMTNIPAGILQAETSPHIDSPIGRAQFYDDVFFDIISGVQPLSEWKVALLDANAVFTASDVSATAILANELHAGSWPQGGIDLTGVTIAKRDTTGLYLTADDVSHIVYGGSMTPRYALIYDGDTDRPLMFVDFQRIVIVENNSRFHLNQGSFGLALVSP